MAFAATSRAFGGSLGRTLLRAGNGLGFCGARFGALSPLGGWLYPGLAATAATAGGFSSSAGRGPLGAPYGAPISPHGTPLASAPTGAVTTLASPLRRTTPGLFPSPMVIEFLRPLKMVNFAVQYLLSFRFYFMFMARTTFQAVRPLLAFSVFGEVMKMVLATMSSGLFSFLFSFVLAFEVLYFFLQCYISYTFLTMFFTVMF